MVRAFQVPGLEHLDAMITWDAVRRNDFEATVVFLSDQMASLKTKNTGTDARTLASMDSSDKDSKHSKHSSHKKTSYNKFKKSGGHGKKYSKEQLDDPKLQHYPDHEWQPLSEAKKQYYRDARRAAGIPEGGIKKKHRKKR